MNDQLIAIDDQGKPRTISVHEAIAYVIREADAVGKSRKNEQQNYKFRSIEDVYNALSPAFGRAGLYTRPVVTSRVATDRTGKTGTVQIHTVLTVDYYFTGPAGDSVVATVIGEAMDTGDKSSNKALSAAHKYALTQVLCLKFAETEDADASSPEPSRAKAATPIAEVNFASAPTAPKSEAQAVDVEKAIGALLVMAQGASTQEALKKVRGEVEALKKLRPDAEKHPLFENLRVAYKLAVDAAKAQFNQNSG